MSTTSASSTVRTLAAATVASATMAGGAAGACLLPSVLPSERLGPPAERLGSGEEEGGVGGESGVEGERRGGGAGPAALSAGDALAMSQLPMALPRFVRRAQPSTAYYTVGRPPRARV